MPPVTYTAGIDVLLCNVKEPEGATNLREVSKGRFFRTRLKHHPAFGSQ
ncbi:MULTISPECIES: hypothetical protein [Legionella]|uniref:Uncharacterized protein n=1 Tax=Legionella resiliens TaxID=2905958 RepID=A0ABS8X337_9GAMM|nr:MULTISPECIES: hypothetical protein [unclassified Legionella]MCE0723249.1 hypothetical protein [Legionella sp. 9fVS26]MCE3532402.1 hypothetical protein [Legionella sp. 8cVS16]